jgi:TolB-like protein/DNA-binding winged helix-turn-helix (wHTH) protein/tetratricopeptide (TPR) repeat protein
MSDSGNFLVGDLVLDMGRGRVMRGENELPLPKLSFDLLLALTRAAPNLLSIDALMEQVWPGLVVSPETVSQRVKLLRDALGDDARLPRYIGVLRGRGYQMIAPVSEVAVEIRLTHGSTASSSAPHQQVESVSPPTAVASENAPKVPYSTVSAAASVPAALRDRRFALTFTAVTLFGMLVCIGVYMYESAQGSKATRGARTDSVVVRGVAPDDGQPPAFSPPARSVAVLSFVNLSGDPREDYFSDGLSEELVNDLARISQLRVAARTSSFSFKGSAVDIPTVGRKLNVSSVLEGSVRRSGRRIRITAQLINALNGYHLWSQTYDRELKDTLAVQSEIATTVAGSLQVTLMGDAAAKITVGGTVNPLAFDAYLRGRHGESIQDEAGLRAALAALDEAISLDPHYADAHAFRGEVLAQLANIWVEDAAERRRLNLEAQSSAERAVAIAPQSGFAHAYLGKVLSGTGSNYARIDAEYRRAMELEPGNAKLVGLYASYGSLFGRPDALSAAKRVVGLDPLSAGAQANLGVALFYARRHDEARAAFQEAMRLSTNPLMTNWAGANELAAGKPGAALPYCEHDPGFWYDQLCLAMAYQRLNRRKEAEAMLQKIKQNQGDDAAYQYAELHAFWGETREALEWLAKAFDLKDSGLAAIKVDPFLDSIRDTPQFKEIVSKLDLPS